MKPYRECVAVALLRPVSACTPTGCGTLYEVLLVHKPRGADAWQLPQGGLEEGETPQHAAVRELQEEVGVAIPAGTTFLTTPHAYQYDYPRSFVRKTHPPYRGQRVQFLGLAVLKDVKATVDGRELDAHLWVLSEDLGKYIRRKGYLGVVREVLGEFLSSISG